MAFLLASASFPVVSSPRTQCWAHNLLNNSSSTLVFTFFRYFHCFSCPNSFVPCLGYTLPLSSLLIRAASSSLTAAPLDRFLSKLDLSIHPSIHPSKTFQYECGIKNWPMPCAWMPLIQQPAHPALSFWCESDQVSSSTWSSLCREQGDTTHSKAPFLTLLLLPISHCSSSSYPGQLLARDQERKYGRVLGKRSCWSLARWTAYGVYLKEEKTLF